MKPKMAKYFLLIADLAAIVLAFRIAYFLRYESGLFRYLSARLPTPPFAAYDYAIMLSLGTWILIFLLYGAHHFPGLGESPFAAAKLITASAFLIASLLAGMYLARAYYSRLLFVFLSILVLCFLLATRVIYQVLLKHLRKYGVGLRRVVIVGHSELAAELAERIERRLDLHYQLVGYLAPAAGRVQENGHAKNGGSEPLLSESETMARELAARDVDELLFAIPIRRKTETLEFIAHCQRMGIVIKCVPEYYDLHTSHIESFSIDGIPILEMKETSLHPSHRVAKRIIDLVLAVCLLPVVIPTAVLVSLALYLGSRRVVKRETRIGLDGKPFTLYRFDVDPPSGRHEADNASGYGLGGGVVAPASCRPGDSLVPSSRQEQSDGAAGFFNVGVRGAAAAPARWCARVARFLDRYSLSELPQIWNVIKGDMSFVGPQPESPERVRHYSAWHKRRLQIKPGITGLAQVKGLRENDSSDLKTKFDLEYAANYTPLVDLALVLATFSTLISRRNTPGPSTGFRPWAASERDPV
jgi:lipopolysaccharide/colanic/teichoic acid biosynthesis glycosyltransferase